jgi:hypothetical protein
MGIHADGHISPTRYRVFTLSRLHPADKILHRALSHFWPPPPSRRASTTDAPTSTRGGWASCEAVPSASCSRRCRTTSSMHHHRPPRRHRAPQRQASIRLSNKMTLRWKSMLQTHVSSVSSRCWCCRSRSGCCKSTSSRKIHKNNKFLGICLLMYICT